LATVSGSLSLAASATWSQSQSNGALQGTTQGPDSLSYRATPDAATYTQVQATQLTLAASASQTLDLSSFTTLLNATATCTKVLGVLVKATNTVTGGQLKIEPGASSAIDFWLGGTTPSLTLACGDPAGPGCAVLIADGAARAVSGSVKNVKLSNPGTQTVTVSVVILCGA
jgi:hypothetical protein